MQVRQRGKHSERRLAFRAFLALVDGATSVAGRLPPSILVGGFFNTLELYANREHCWTSQQWHTEHFC
jgi:hypothetical protein